MLRVDGRYGLRSEVAPGDGLANRPIGIVGFGNSSDAVSQDDLPESHLAVKTLSVQHRTSASINRKELDSHPYLAGLKLTQFFGLQLKVLWQGRADWPLEQDNAGG